MEKIKINYLHNHIDYKVAQHDDMYHFNTDTCLLGEFIKINENENVLDVGTNNGALLVYIIHKGGIATGIDINIDALEIAKLTLKENNMTASLIGLDFKEYINEEKYDVIVSNPPYFNSDNKSEKYYIRIARHEEFLNLESLIKGMALNLKPSGRIYMVHRPERLKDIQKQCLKNGLFINTIQYAYDKINKIVKSMLIEASFENKELITLENIYI